MITLPQAFIDQMAVQLKDELPAFLAAMQEPYKRGIRINPFKQAALPDLLDPVPWEPNGYYLTADSQIGATALHEAGACYIQEPCAMLPAAVLNAQPGEIVLDLCSAPGGKATQNGLRMRGQGLLVCNEPVPKRAQILSRNIERMGIPNALVISAMPEKLAARWPGMFDAVQVDAPCSGEGMFRRHPETIEEWTPDSPEGCAKRQAVILDSASVLVRDGGRLVYSTCTMNPVENEQTVSAFMDRHPEFETEAFSLPGAEAPNGMLTCYPQRMKGEGHFIALLRKKGDAGSCIPYDRSLPVPDKQMIQAVCAFSPSAPKPTHLLGSTLVAAPILPDIRGLKVLRAGLHLGECKGKLFIPDHAWALSIDPPSFDRFELDENESSGWLHG